MNKSFIRDNPMKDEMTNVNHSKTKNLYESFIEKIEYKAYCISCFITSIWEKYSYNLMSNNKEVISIENVYQAKTYMNNNEFLINIHLINFNKNYKFLKTISLKLISDDEYKDLNLIDLNFNPDKDKVIFYNLLIKKNSIISIQDINNKKIIEEKNIVYALKESEKLKYFLDYFEQKDLMEDFDDFKINLAEKFIIHSKQKNIFYSDIIKIFCILNETEKITLLLDNYENFDYCFDDVKNEKFKEIFDLYKKDINSLFSKNIHYFISKKKDKKEEVIRKYKNALENFMIFYDLFYGHSKAIEKQKIANIIPTISNIIKNKTDLNELTWFIGKELEIFFQLFGKQKKIQIENDMNNFEEEEVFINFKIAYMHLINEEENYGFVFDYSKIFNKLINIYNQYEFLIDIKKLYEKELKKIPNPDFLQQVNDKIHYSGMERINQKSDNNFLIMNIITIKKVKKMKKKIFQY